MPNDKNSMLNIETPLILLGGMENTLSITRSLGRLGINVYVAAPHICAAHYSRFCEKSWIVPEDFNEETFYRQLFIDQTPTHLKGAVIMPCSDSAIQFIAKYSAALSSHYRLDYAKPEQQLALLDKQETLRMAKAVGCPAPAFWDVKTIEDIKAIEQEITYPVLIKPILSHKFQQIFQAKLFSIENKDDLFEKSVQVLAANLEFMICEHIPGPDSLLNSYYTYIDDKGKEYFSFTKRMIRRSPKNFGGGCLHATQKLPLTAEMGQRFFRGTNFRGLGNIEFKTDPRDGQLKIIECNARFTAAQELVLQSGMDIALIIYRHLSGQTCEYQDDYREHLYYWYPLGDLSALKELRGLGELTLINWIKSFLKPIVFPYFSFLDPKPFAFMFKHQVFPRFNHAMRRRVAVK